MANNEILENEQNLEVASGQVQEANMEPTDERLSNVADPDGGKSVEQWGSIPQGKVLPNIVDGKTFGEGAVEELKWLKEIGSSVNRTDFNSKFEVLKLQKSLRPWLQYHGKGFMIGADGIPGDRTIKALDMFNSISPLQIKNRAKMVSDSEEIDSYMFNKMKEQEFDLFDQQK